MSQRPKVRNTITNPDFEKALKNLDYVRIMGKVCSKYRFMIPEDELGRCKLIALWEAMKSFDPEGGRKFTSFLYNRITWECQKQLADINKHRRNVSFDCEYGDLFVEMNNIRSKIEIQELFNQLDSPFKEVLHQRFFEQLTMEEIGERNNYSRETARRYILKAIEKVKQCIPN